MHVPDAARTRAELAGAQAWLAELPQLIEHLAARWRFTVGEPYDEGTEAVVARVDLADGRAAVLKLLVPHDRTGLDREATVLCLAAGDACPELYEHDVLAGAFLMERLGPSMFRLDVPIRRRHDILADIASRLWRPAPDAGLPTGAEKAVWLGEQIAATWERLGRPCSAAAVEHALECAARRAAAHDDERARLVHGDVHRWNALQAGDGWKLIDPDGLHAEPEYDLGIIMREDPVELLDGDPRDRSRRLAARTGCDETAIWEWGVVERVSTGLVCTEIDLQPEGRQMLAAAEAVVGC